MNRTMLINGRHAEELRVAIVEDGQLLSYEVEIAEGQDQRGNIYRGVVANIEPSLDAAFIDFGDDKSGFLSFNDLAESAYHNKVKGRATIDKVLNVGQTIMVQVQKEAVGNKGAALTSNISIAGRYLVFMPLDESQRGLSRKVEDEELRKDIKEKARNLKLPPHSGYIMRTNAVNVSEDEWNIDLETLVGLWRSLEESFEQGEEPALLYDDQDLLMQTIRDFLDTSITRVLIDDEKLFKRAEKLLKSIVTNQELSFEYYRSRVPLFSRLNIEPQIAEIYQRKVSLPSGASIVIDHTEALTAIDVNSGRARSSNQEETAYQTNLEAAVHIARQLRLRDIGGLIVIDFIDLRAHHKQREVERVLAEELKKDRARTNMGRFSPNCLLEINRQRIRQSLQLKTHRVCPTCLGAGHLLTPELLGLNILRRIEFRASTKKLKAVHVSLHPELAHVVQNIRRGQLAAVEREYRITIEITAEPKLQRGEEHIEWITKDGSSFYDQPGRERSRSRHKTDKRRDNRSDRKSSDYKRKFRSGSEHERNDGDQSDRSQNDRSQSDQGHGDRSQSNRSQNDRNYRDNNRKRKRGRRGKGDRYGNRDPRNKDQRSHDQRNENQQQDDVRFQQNYDKRYGREKSLTELFSERNSKKNTDRKRKNISEQSLAEDRVSRDSLVEKTDMKDVNPRQKEKAATKKAATKKAATKKTATKKAATKKAATKKAATKKATTKKAATKKAATKKAATKKAATKKAATKKATTKKATTKKATTKKATTKKATTKKATTKKATTKKSVSKAKAKKKTTTKKAVKKATKK